MDRWTDGEEARAGLDRWTEASEKTNSKIGEARRVLKQMKAQAEKRALYIIRQCDNWLRTHTNMEGFTIEEQCCIVPKHW